MPSTIVEKDKPLYGAWICGWTLGERVRRSFWRSNVMDSARVFLAAVGDVNSPITWSGIPYHFLQEARRQGLIDEGLRLSADGPRWKLRRAAWNLRRLLAGDKPGGYQYSTPFLERLWRPVRGKIAGGAVINCFQLYPPSVVGDHSVEKWFYIDMTLRQLFEYYGLRDSIGHRIMADALKREREGYESARGIIAHSHWAARSVVQDYAIPPERVHVVVPGANIDPVEYEGWEREREGRVPAREDLKLVFVGKYWKRKGLDRLLCAFRLACQEGLNGSLRVIGCPRDSVPLQYRDITGVEWLGFLDKRADPAGFLRAVAEADVGCLLSRVEAGGMALREYQALGLIVLGPATGGAPEHMIDGASIAVLGEATEREIANMLLELWRNRERFERLRSKAWEVRRSALWGESVRQILGFWPTTAGPRRQQPWPCATGI